MEINGWKKNILITVVFLVYLFVGSAIYYGIEKDAPPAKPGPMVMYMMKIMSEKQLQGIQMGMNMTVPMVAQKYKADTGKESFDEADVSKIAEISLNNVIAMVQQQMAARMSGETNSPQAHRQSANGHHASGTEGTAEGNPPYNNVPSDDDKDGAPATDEKEMDTDDKTLAEEETNGNTLDGGRKKRQADNVTEESLMENSNATDAPAPHHPHQHHEKKEGMGDEPPKPGYLAYIALVTSAISTIGYGTLVPKTSGSIVFFMIYTTLGIPLFFYMICRIALAQRAAAIAAHSAIVRKIGKESTMSTRVRNVSRLLMVFTIGFILIFLVCSAIFSHVEGWSYLQAFYFVYQTVTTIGFGDYSAGLMAGIGDPMEISHSIRRVYGTFLLVFIIVSISWMATMGVMIADCCRNCHQSKTIKQTNGGVKATPPKITVENEKERKTAEPLLDDTANENMEEMKDMKPSEETA